MRDKLVGGVIIGGLVLAFLTRPTRADHEAYVKEQVAAAQHAALGQGKLGTYLLGAGLDLTRGGQFKNGLLTSTYTVTYLGQPTFKCTGILGMISCDAIED